MSVDELAERYNRYVVREWQLRYKLMDEPDNEGLRWAHTQASSRLKTARKRLMEATR